MCSELILSTTLWLILLKSLWNPGQIAEHSYSVYYSFGVHSSNLDNWIYVTWNMKDGDLGGSWLGPNLFAETSHTMKQYPWVLRSQNYIMSSH